MNAAATAAMAVADAAETPGEPAHAGRTVLTGRALHHLAIALVQDTARVPAKNVSVTLSDERGMLRAAVVLPAVFRPGPAQGESLVERGAALRNAVINGMRTLAGRQVATVDVRFLGVQLDSGGRVS